MKKDSAVHIACRVRPFVSRADGDVYSNVFQLDTKKKSIETTEGYRHMRATFDAMFGPEAQNSTVYDEIVAPMIPAMLQGINATVLTYGQTGSGKTHTLTGTAGDPGLTPRIIQGLFDAFETSPETYEFLIKVSYLEIYCERVRDLLAGPSHRNSGQAPSLIIRESPETGVYVEGAVEQYVGSPEELLGLIRFGEANRSIGATGMNEASSRSHSIISIIITSRDTLTDSQRTARLSLVDLAGSEAVSRTGAEGVILEEAKNINKSLFTLSKCISTIAQAQTNKNPNQAGNHGDGEEAPGGLTPARREPRNLPHIPYRDSKLTRLLQDSLGGNASVVLIVTVSPAAINLVESLSTIRFGMQAKLLPNAPVVNNVRSIAELERLLARAEKAIDLQANIIQSLQGQLNTALNGGSDDRDDDSVYRSRRRRHRRRHADGSGSGSDDDSDGSHSSYPYTDSEDEARGQIDSEASPKQEWGGAGDTPLPSSSSRKHKSSGKDRDAKGNQETGRDLVSPKHSLALGKDEYLPLSPDSSLGGRASGRLTSSAELSRLRLEVEAMREELKKREEELQMASQEAGALEDEIAVRDRKITALLAEKETAISQAKEQSRLEAMESVLASLRSAASCTVCQKNPFQDVTSVHAIALLHEQLCYENSEARNACKRAEERNSALARELSDLKELNAELKKEAVAAQSAAKAAASVPVSNSDPGSDAAVQAIQQELANTRSRFGVLLNVHRQLLRKYAVADAEASDLSDVCSERDMRINELNAQILTLRKDFDSERKEAKETFHEERVRYQTTIEQMQEKINALLSNREANFPESGTTFSSRTTVPIKPLRGGAITDRNPYE